MSYKILLVDDNNEMYKWVKEYNESHRLHYSITQIKSDIDLHEYLLNNSTDLILMSWSLNHGKGGVEYMKEIKFNTATGNIPIILCSCRNCENEQVQGLNQGADDFYLKDSCKDLLFSKINAILRKQDKDKNTKVNLMKKFFFLDDSLEVEHVGHRHKLTNKEFKIFKTLVDNPGKVFSQEDLNRITSGEGVFVSRRCVDTFVNLLRKKLGKECIVSIRKKGYKLNDKLMEFSNSIFASDKE